MEILNIVAVFLFILFVLFVIAAGIDISQEEGNKFFKQLPTLLIVDDEGHILQDIQKYFEKYHNKYYIRVSATVNDAKKVLDDKKPKIAIIDLNLGQEGEFAGIKIIEYILKNKKPTHLIVLSGSSFAEKKQDFESASFTPEELEKIENSYVEKGCGNYILNLIDKMEKMEEQQG